MPSNKQLLLNNEHRLLGLMLFCLLTAIHIGDTNSLAKSFLIIHFGFFLLWQPVVKQEFTFSSKNLVIITTLIAAYIYFSNPWLTIFWTLLLLTLLTGRIFARGLSRAIYGFAVIILFLEITLHSTPSLFGLSALSSTLQGIFNNVIILLPLVLLFVPSTDNSAKPVDFIRGFLIILLLIFICMSSVLIALTTQLSYIESLASSVMVVSFFLLLTALLWAPRAGFSGLAQLLEKYLLNIGGPFEQWISHVSTLIANPHIKPSQLLSASLKYLMQQHWICGVSWKTNDEEKIIGDLSNHRVEIDDENLSLVIYAYTPIGPSLFLHSKLLLSVLTFYYHAKLQEQQLINQTHMQAIYETGSKLTHDVKNILQSTQTMTKIIYENDEDSLEIIKKQMPLLTQRLNTTLEKLRTPDTSNSTNTIETGSLHHWWNQLQQRYTGRNICFISDISVDHVIHLDVYTTVIENLLENARRKRILQPDIEIIVELTKTDTKINLLVTDTGMAIKEEVNKVLFHAVITSNDGFGIGLLQSFELAEKNNYSLSLKTNMDGCVSFLLS